jgi:hypothetical protein
MTIDFASMLSNDQKRQLILNRIQQFVAEGYQLTLNKRTAESLGSNTQVESTEKAIAVLEEAIRVHKEELDKIPSTEEQA